MQESKEHVTVSKQVKRELERRKVVLSKSTGRKVSFDFVIRHMLGWS
jgi:hypothetical protein